MQEVKLPEIGDGITSGTVVSILIKPGDTINEKDSVLELETDKAVVEIPAKVSGTVKEVTVTEGAQINVGEVIFTLDAETTEATPTQPSESTSPNPAKAVSNSNANNTVSKVSVTLPQIDEGIDQGTVTSVLKQIGDSIEKGEPIIELETDKAVLPVPSSESGVITDLLVKENDVLKVGDSICQLDSTSSTTTKTDEKEVAPPPAQVTESPEELTTQPAASTPPSTQSTKASQTNTSNSSQILAGPATRKLARELGIDLANVSGSCRGGRIDQADVKHYTKSLVQGSNTNGGSGNPIPLPDFTEFGEVEIKKASNLRKTIANHIHRAWNEIPHVHQFDEVMVDKMLSYQKKYKEEFKEQGSTLSVTIFIIKALSQALNKFPQFNSSYNSLTNEVHYKKYFNIGVAVDTPEGLIVPVIKGVEAMNLFQIGIALKDLAKQTRERKVKPQDLKGACITLSNLGGIGGTHFTPIVNSPEVAIMGTGRNYDKVVVDQNSPKDNPKFVVKSYLPICLAYDHRVIDGADGARFITYFKSLLEYPEKLSLGI